MAGKNFMISNDDYRSVVSPLTAMDFRREKYKWRQEKARVLMRALKLHRESRETDKPQEKTS